MADDAVQESLIKVWRNLHQFHGGNMTGWLVRITTNTCYDMLRHYRRQPAMIDIDAIGDMVGDDDPADAVIRDEQSVRVCNAVAALSDHHRLAVEMVCLHEMAYADVAATMGVPVGTVKSKVSRGRAALKVLVGE